MLFAAAWFVAAALGVVAAVQGYGIQQPVIILLIAVLAVASENTAPEIGGYSISLALPLAMSAMLLEGPLAAALVAGVSALKPEIVRSAKGAWLGVYNMGQLVTVTLLAGWSYVWLGGRLLTEVDAAGVVTVPLGSADFPAVVIPLFVAAAVCALGNLGATSLGVSTLYEIRVRDILGSALGHLPSMLALAAVGYLIGQVIASSALALVFFVFPLVVARDLYQRFKSMKNAYLDTIRSFVGALEAKDPYTRGHSERVASYSMAIGRQLGLDTRALETLEHSALLHDLGKIALSRGILTKPGMLTSDEMDTMRGHPAAGAEMVKRVPPLADLETCIRQHHEMYDGGGYPNGVAGDQIEFMARILAVADAFDAMTSDRAYRSALTIDEAMRRLRECAGTQFDPAVVDAFLASDECALQASGAEVGSSPVVAR